MDSTVTAFITLTLVLQAAHVKAGKSVRDKTSLKNKKKKFSALGKKGGTERRLASKVGG